MSKLRRTFYPLGIILLAAGVSAAQTAAFKIKLGSEQPPVVSVAGRYSGAPAGNGKRNFSFLRSAAGAENLAARVGRLNLADQAGRAVAYKQLMAGEYLAEGDFAAFDYEMKLGPLPPPAAAAHASWVDAERGILMLADLLPERAARAAAHVEFELPPGWRITTAEKSSGANVYEVPDAEKAVFLIGKNQREEETSGGGFRLRLAVAGEFLFADEEALKAAGEIAGEYERLFGGSPPAPAQILLVKSAAAEGVWEAETRGASVVIVSGDMPFKNQSIQRLHEQLRHEIFHLWMPNGLNLSGNYDWFYEGFALYQSLRTGVKLNRLRFEDFLDTLARAYDIDSSQTTRRISLVEASKNRWNGAANTQIYARGMLVAFLTDVALLEKSKGKKSLESLLRQIYQAHRPPGTRADGDAAILGIFEQTPELRPLARKYVAGTENIAWQSTLAALGIESKEENLTTNLSVGRKLSGRQKDLLDELGYNNWRKLAPNAK